jgi:FkbM family methyltransferase
MLGRLVLIVSWLQRYLVATRNFGVISAFRMLILRRGRMYPNGTSIFVKGLGRPIHYRGASDIGVISHFFYPGYRILDTPEHPVRCIIDAGANIGDETLRFRHFHKHARIIALEPETQNFTYLSLNVSSDRQIIPLQKGLWSHECRLRIKPGSGNEAFRVEETDGAPSEDDVQAVSIPSLMRDYQLAEIDILKLDIEGAEYDVFDERSHEWVDKVKVLIFECPDNDRPGAAFRIFQAVGKHNFNCFVHGESIILIRRDLPWKLETTLFLDS